MKKLKAPILLAKQTFSTSKAAIKMKWDLV